MTPSPPFNWTMVGGSRRDSVRNGRGGTKYSINAVNFCVGLEINDLSMAPLICSGDTATGSCYADPERKSSSASMSCPLIQLTSSRTIHRDPGTKTKSSCTVQLVGDRIIITVIMYMRRKHWNYQNHRTNADCHQRVLLASPSGKIEEHWYMSVVHRCACFYA
jgi:hypothetical protein